MSTVSASTVPLKDQNIDFIAVARKLAEQFAETAVKREEDGALPHAEIQALKDAGLVNFLIPREFGGDGGGLAEAADIVFEISKGDASIGMLLAFHYKHVLVPPSLDYIHDGADLLRQSAANKWFWGNITGTWDLKAEPLSGGRYSVSGTKKMCTGTSVSDVVAVAARRADIERNQQVHFVIDANHERLHNHNDWGRYPGLKLTATDTFTVNDLIVDADRVVPHTHGTPLETFPPFYSEYGMSLYAAILLGAAYGALEGAANYTRKISGPRTWAGVDAPTADPLTLHSYGDFWIKLETVHALFEKFSNRVEKAWVNRKTVSEQELTDIAVRGQALRVAVANAGLHVSSHIFDVTGARSLSVDYGLERHYRDIRMLTTHEPLMYWIRNIGDYFINGNYTRVQFNAPSK